MIVIPQAVNTV